jgi:hypothetical protein
VWHDAGHGPFDEGDNWLTPSIYNDDASTILQARKRPVGDSVFLIKKRPRGWSTADGWDHSGDKRTRKIERSKITALLLHGQR